MKMPTLVRPVRAPTRIVEGVEGPSGRIIELPHADLTIGSSDGPLTLTGPYFGDESGSTVVRAWIGMDTGRGQQWWPPEGQLPEGSVKVLLAEGFDGGYGYAAYNQGYFVGDWAPGSYPTPWPSAGGWWGTRRLWPTPTGGNPDRVGVVGVDWNPFTQVLCCLMGEYNAAWPGNGYHFTMFRSTDFGDTWTEIQDVTGSDPGAGIGYNYASNGSWYRDWYWTDGSYSQAQPRGDGLRYCGGLTWAYGFQDGGLFIFSEDDGLTWHNPGGSFMSDGTAHRLPTFADPNVEHYYSLNWLTYDGIFQGDMGTNWAVNSADGPFRSLCANPVSTPRVVWGQSAVKVATTAGVGGNQWNIAAELYSQDTSQGVYWRAGIIPYVSDPNQFMIHGRYGLPAASSFRFVPGNSSNVWLYSDGETGYADGRIARVNENFGPSTILGVTGSTHYIVSPTFQSNVYTGWAYGGSPTAQALRGGQIMVTPHPTVSGAWRAWHVDGLVVFYGNNGYTVCYSDDQGSSWTTQADYSRGGASTRFQWIGMGQHPFFYPGQAPGDCYISDLVFHPSDPKTLLSVGRAGATVNYSQAASYDGGNTWDDLVQFNDYASGGPNRTGRMVVMYSATESMATTEISRETFGAGVVCHAPIALLEGQRLVSPAPAIAHAPGVDVAVRTAYSAPMVISAPAVGTAPAYLPVSPAPAVMHAPAAFTGHALLAPAVGVMAAPECVAYQEAKISLYKIVGSAPLIMYAPPWTTYLDISAVSVIAHAPKVLITGGGLVEVTGTSMVIHAPAVIPTGGEDPSFSGHPISEGGFA